MNHRYQQGVRVYKKATLKYEKYILFINVSKQKCPSTTRRLNIVPKECNDFHKRNNDTCQAKVNRGPLRQLRKCVGIRTVLRKSIVTVLDSIGKDMKLLK